ncbi:hypothetical protein ACOMHN_010153 [Nucella lapillus]
MATPWSSVMPNSSGQGRQPGSNSHSDNSGRSDHSSTHRSTGSGYNADVESLSSSDSHTSAATFKGPFSSRFPSGISPGVRDTEPAPMTDKREDYSSDPTPGSLTEIEIFDDVSPMTSDESDSLGSHSVFSAEDDACQPPRARILVWPSTDDDRKSGGSNKSDPLYKSISDSFDSDVPYMNFGRGATCEQRNQLAER